MSKPKKEFKRRVGKMQKHVTALIEIAPSDDQRATLYEIEQKLSWLAETAEAWFDENAADPPGCPPSEKRKPAHDIAN